MQWHKYLLRVKLGRIKISTTLTCPRKGQAKKGGDGCQGVMLCKGEEQSAVSALPPLFGNETGHLHFEAAALHVQDKMITLKCHCCQNVMSK